MTMPREPGRDDMVSDCCDRDIEPREDYIVGWPPVSRWTRACSCEFRKTSCAFRHRLYRDGHE